MKEVSIELLNKVLNYLATRPYIEVAEMIAEISKLNDVKVVKKEEELQQTK